MIIKGSYLLAIIYQGERNLEWIMEEQKDKYQLWPWNQLRDRGYIGNLPLGNFSLQIQADLNIQKSCSVKLYREDLPREVDLGGARHEILQRRGVCKLFVKGLEYKLVGHIGSFVNT